MLKVDSLDDHTCTCLDICFFKGPSWKHSNLLGHKVHITHTSVYTPLADTSSHPPHVHLAWVDAMPKRCIDLCNIAQSALAAIRALRDGIGLRMGSGYFDAVTMHRRRQMTSPPQPPLTQFDTRLIIPWPPVWQLSALAAECDGRSMRQQLSAMTAECDGSCLRWLSEAAKCS